ncbi:MAG: hypothetical protein SFZ24_08635 [Planctomycetota bacterium]|nr:hypothetical protein [Planctomycetota bacterium]
MVVGLPGTGIGGLFYLFMALWMPLHELYRLARGRSSLERWRFIAINWVIVGGILACLWVTMLVVKSLLILTGLDKPKGLLENAGLLDGLASETNSLFASAGGASALSLVALVMIVQVLRFTVGRSALRGAAVKA